MKSRKRNRILSLLLAMVMVVGVFVVPTPDVVSAASKEKSFRSTGKSSVTIKDSECYKGSSSTPVKHYIKYKAGVTGTITLKMINNSKEWANTYGYLTLCDSKKKVIGTTDEWWSTTNDDSRFFVRTYGVKKGKTYYFRVQAVSGVKITATVKSVKDQKNHSKTKAKSLKAKAKATGVIMANDKTADWYKITVPANKRVKVSVTATTNGMKRVSSSEVGATGAIKATLMKSNGKAFKKDAYCLGTVLEKSDWCKYFMRNAYGQQFGVSDKKATFYIKVERYNTASSGSYTLKWEAY